MGLAALAAGLRFAALTRQSFWYDEAVSVELARHSLGELLSGRVKDLGNPPLYPALLHLWMAVFGSSDAAVRALSALLGTLTIPVTVALARGIFSDRVGFLAGTLLALAPFHLQMSQEARGYTLLSFLGVSAGLAVVRATRAPERWGYWVLLALSTAGMALTHYFGLFLALAQAIYILIAYRKNRTVLLRAIAAYVGSALIFAFWLPSLFGQLGVAGNLSRSAESWYLHLVATPLVFSMGTALVWKDSATVLRAVVGVLGTLAVTIAAGLGIWRKIQQGHRSARLLLLWLVLPLAIPALLSLASPLYNTRYVILASLPFFIFAAAGLEEMQPRARAIVGGLMVATMTAGTLSYLPVLDARRALKHEWREAARFVEAVKRPTDLLLFETDYNETAYARYAGAGSNRIRLLPPPETAAPDHLYGASAAGAKEKDVSGEIAGKNRVWLILADARPDAAERAREFLGKHGFRAGPATKLRGISIELFERAPPS